MAERRGISLEDLMVQQRMTNRLLVAFLQRASPRHFNVASLSALLAKTGATVSEIADAIGSTPGSVGVSLNRKKKHGKGKAARERGPSVGPAGAKTGEPGGDGGGERNE
jgi:hypothetical protein